MPQCRINLVPFSWEDSASAPSIEVVVQQSPSALVLNFIIQDPTDLIEWPSLSTSPTRKNHLWKETCFELFFTTSTASHTNYREWNFSPSKDWQAYDFSSYRAPLPPRLAQTDCTPLISIRPGRMQIELENLFLPEDSFVNFTAMIKLRDGQLVAYAAKHPRDGADFHARGTFMKWSSLCQSLPKL